MRNEIRYMILIGVLLGSCWQVSNAQIKPPGFEREQEQLRQMQGMSPLDRDSVTLTERISIIDPVSGESGEQTVHSIMSWKDYCQLILGMNNPESLLDGKPHTITNPETYTDMQVQWNTATNKLDTLQHR